MLIISSLCCLIAIATYADAGFPCASQHTMKPNLAGKPQLIGENPPPYKLFILNSRGERVKYYKDETYTVILNGTASFQQFLMQARLSTRQGFVIGHLRAGEFLSDKGWTDSGVQIQNCPPVFNDSITNANEDEKKSIELKWRARRNDGAIQFVLSVVKDKKTFWIQWSPETGLILPDSDAKFTEQVSFPLKSVIPEISKGGSKVIISSNLSASNFPDDKIDGSLDSDGIGKSGHKVESHHLELNATELGDHEMNNTLSNNHTLSSNETTFKIQYSAKKALNISTAVISSNDTDEYYDDTTLFPDVTMKTGAFNVSKAVLNGTSKGGSKLVTPKATPAEGSKQESDEDEESKENNKPTPAAFISKKPANQATTKKVSKSEEEYSEEEESKEATPAKPKFPVTAKVVVQQTTSKKSSPRITTMASAEDDDSDEHTKRTDATAKATNIPTVDKKHFVTSEEASEESEEKATTKKPKSKKTSSGTQRPKGSGSEEADGHAGLFPDSSTEVMSNHKKNVTAEKKTKPKEDYCSSFPCYNNGTCESLVSKRTFQCKCTRRWLGDQCLVRNYCGDDPCLHNGECVNSEEERGYSCKCKPDWAGDNCDRPCPSYLCQNGGSCYIGAKNGEYLCSCPKGFSGLKCETEINECLSNPCLNDGKCTDKRGGFSCQCKAGFMGETCHRPCQDIYSSCSSWRDEDKCETMRPTTKFFDINCARTCEQCVFDNNTIHTFTPLAPVLEPFEPFLGTWNINYTTSRRFPTDFAKAQEGYYEELSFHVANVTMFGTPAINFSAVAVTNDKSRDGMTNIGFMTLKPNLDPLKVSIMSTGNDGMTVIEEGLLKNGQMNLTTQYFAALSSVKTPKEITRQFIISGSYLQENVIRTDSEGRIDSFTKYYYRLKKSMNY